MAEPLEEAEEEFGWCIQFRFFISIYYGSQSTVDSDPWTIQISNSSQDLPMQP
jgi:hypothetical protein